MTQRYLLALLGAIVLGAVGGVAAPTRTAAAVEQIIIDIYPGTEDTDPHYMNCGWHGVCVSPWTTGRAIDFRNYASSDANWRSKTNCTGSGTPTAVAWTAVTGSTTGCNKVTVRLTDTFSAWVGTVYFTHTDKNGSDFTVLGDNGVHPQTNKVGDATAAPDSGCTYDDPHLREQAASIPDRYSNNYPTASENHSDGNDRGDVWASGNRLLRAAWTE